MEKLVDKNSQVVVKKNNEDFVITVKELVEFFEKHHSNISVKEVSLETATIKVEFLVEKGYRLMRYGFDLEINWEGCSS